MKFLSNDKISKKIKNLEKDFEGMGTFINAQKLMQFANENS